MNKVILIGNLTRDPELKTTQGGTTLCTAGIATNERWTDKDGEKQERVTFHNLVVWGKQAEVFAQYLRKGKKVMVEGRVDNRTWEKEDGSKGYASEVVVQNFEFLSPKGSGGGTPDPEPDGMDAVKERMKDVPKPKGRKDDADGPIAVEDIPF